MDRLFSILPFLLVSFSLFSQSQQKKIALVIGAQNYTSLPPLRNSLNDAKAMTTALKGKGFQVEALNDPKTKKEIKDAITRYFNQMRDQIDAVGVIYYAGHGMQWEGDNYIIPTSATIDNPGDLEDYCVKMNTIMAVLKTATKSLNILLLDACRTLPSFTRDNEQGLTRMVAPRGSIIVFAAEPGKVASDGRGANGLFTSKLLQVINEPNLNVSDLFKKVREQVFVESGEQQLPSVVDESIGVNFYFTPTQAGTKINNTQPISTPEVVIATPDYKAPDYGYGVIDAPTVDVGNQRWLGKNLNVDHFANGDRIPQVQSDEEWKRIAEEKQPAWCYYNNDSVKGYNYGKLYNWYAVHDSRGLAPRGWHIPSDPEWTQLSDHLGGETIAGTKMKSIDLWENDGNGNNNSLFSGLPSGERGAEGTFGYIGVYCGWWSSSESPPEKALLRSLSVGTGRALRVIATKGKGFSVRCIKD